MGSSKKHKEKDRDRDRDRKRKRKHRSRSRERSGSRERKHHREHAEKKHEKRHKDRREARGYDEEKDVPVKSQSGYRYPEAEHDDLDLLVGALQTAQEIESQSFVPKADPEPVAAPSGGGDLSLSIEETNKLRAKLGLKPLEVGNSEVKEEKESLKDDIHVPAVNMAEKIKTDQLREKMQQIKEKRRINQKLGKVKTLGDSDSDEEGVMAWVKKSRKLQKDRIEAEKRAKALEEMDAEFGVGNLVEEAFGTKKKTNYSSKHLKGLAVEHAQESFKEGRTVILTLKDQGVLNDEDDTLVNVNMQDSEKAEKNIENKKKKPDYNPYDEPIVDEYGMLKQKEVLDKYNDEIHGEKINRFQLGSGGKYDTYQERQIEQMKRELHQKGESLTLAEPNLASEYLTTEEEMATFKKVKKKVRKIRKKPKVLKADDLIPLHEKYAGDSSRRRRPKRPGEVDEPIDPSVMPKEETSIPGLDLVPSAPEESIEVMDMEVDELDLEETEILGPEEDLSGVVIDDEAGIELELALNKARKLRQKKVRSIPEQIVAAQIQPNEEEMDSATGEKLNITLNSISEFCRTLGDIPTYGQAGNREEDKDDLMDFERELIEERKRQQEEEDANTGWQTVDIDTRPVDIGNEEHAALDEEPVIDAGIGGALALAEKKGYLEDEDAKKGNNAPMHMHLLAQNYSIEDKRYDDLDEKYRKRERYVGGITQEFKELGHYRPDVKLEYVDETGRALNSKEAFRQLSHRFHGKGSGKKKTEKRSKKIQEENLMKQMSSTDTPLGTLNLLKEKQKAEKSPFVVLSGGKGSLSSASITKLAQ